MHESCSRHAEAIRADIDGDGHGDLVWRDRVGTSVFVGACTSARTETRVAVTGEGEGEFHAIDVEPDGRFEVIQGGRSATKTLAEVVVFDAGRLWVIDEIALENGGSAVDGTSVRARDAWGCEDLDGDGARELVQAKTSLDPMGATVRRLNGYKLRGRTAVMVTAPATRLDRFSSEAGFIAPC